METICSMFVSLVYFDFLASLAFFNFLDTKYEIKENKFKFAESVNRK